MCSKVVYVGRVSKGLIWLWVLRPGGWPGSAGRAVAERAKREGTDVLGGKDGRPHGRRYFFAVEQLLCAAFLIVDIIHPILSPNMS